MLLLLVYEKSANFSFFFVQVLGTRYLMHHPYPEFERVMKQCTEIFISWGDNYENISGIMRDLMKKKREENMKLVWRANTGSGHKALQARMESMKKYVTDWVCIARVLLEF